MRNLTPAILLLTLLAACAPGQGQMQVPADFDGDGIPDSEDTDADGDGIPDAEDTDIDLGDTGDTGTTDTDTTGTDTGTTDTGTTDTGTPPDPLDVDDDLDGYTENEGDCDDGQPAINPIATDIVGDTIDQNCDGVDGFDADGDGHADFVSGGDDCDDTDNFVFPGAVEIWYDGVPQDCADVGDPAWPGDGDQDGDGYDAEGVGGTDCTDTDPDIYAERTEDNTNGVDDNCNGVVDDFRVVLNWNPNVDPTLTVEVTDINEVNVDPSGNITFGMFPLDWTQAEEMTLVFDPVTSSAYGELDRSETLLEAEFTTLYYVLGLAHAESLYAFCWGYQQPVIMAGLCDEVDLTTL